MLRLPAVVIGFVAWVTANRAPTGLDVNARTEARIPQATGLGDRSSAITASTVRSTVRGGR